MESERGLFEAKIKEKILWIFKDFLTRVTKLEELGALGGRLLVASSKGLVSVSIACNEFLRRPPINRKAELMDIILKANETERLKSYMATRCLNNRDSIQSVSKSESIINELENLLADGSFAITDNGSISPLRNKYLYADMDQQATTNQEESPSSDFQELEMTDSAALMGIIYSMLKQDYVMQERIVASLNLKSLPGELESYCLMWSLRPFINDEIMLHAWRHIH